jgi:hypothetical protein
MVFADWHPVTHDFGIIDAHVEDVVKELRLWHSGIGITYGRRDINSTLKAGFEALLPLSHGKRRRLFVNTRSGWTACFQNGIQGSDPFPAMSTLAKRLEVLAMRVCSTPPKAVWPGVIWEVYAPEKLGGQSPLGYRRSVCAANDGGRWTFDQSGVPFEFEEVATYSAKRKRDRFTHRTLERYLSHFGLVPIDDEFYVVNESSPAVILERPPRANDPPDFTLAEVKAGKPWQRPRSAS